MKKNTGLGACSQKVLWHKRGTGEQKGAHAGRASTKLWKHFWGLDQKAQVFVVREKRRWARASEGRQKKQTRRDLSKAPDQRGA